ncbi:CdaR family protein [Deferrisoma camini]|uniref:CdaR family protein n=1 Tax=Deferrisoma camini TaxID=1035120 RepID=UPI00046CBF0A|nr:CdaR family protein [Deferrisoma camini]
MTLRWQAWFTENWGLKLVSLGFAILLWMFVVGEKRSEISLTVPLELTGMPADRVIVSPVPEAIRIRVNGPRTLLAAIDPDKLRVTLNLDGIQPGISAFEILPSRLNLPRGVDVTYISPSVVTLEADRKVEKVLRVKPRIRGAPAEGFEVASVEVEPAEVRVQGAERALRDRKEIPTEPVDITGATGGVVQPVGLALPDPTVRPVDVATVRVSVSVREVVAEREFLGVPVEVGPGGGRVVPPEVRVKVRGPLRIVSKLSPDDLRVYPEPGGTGVVRVFVEAPSTVEVVEVDPQSVERLAPEPPEVPTPGSGTTPAEKDAAPTSE